MDESELLGGLKKRDNNSFRVFVDKYQLLVINSCLGFVHNREEAEDIAQEVFIQAYISAKDFRGESAISTWLYKIAVNKSLNFIRDNKKRQNDISISALKENNSNFDISSGNNLQSDSNMIDEDRKRNLHLAIDSLPENQKTAFVLNKYEDLSYKEIADVMELSVSSVESLLFRAKQNLQIKLFECYKKMNE